MTYCKDLFSVNKRWQTDLHIVKSNSVTLFPACAPTESLKEATSDHQRVSENGFTFNAKDATTLMDMCANYTCVGNVRKLFDKMSDVITVILTVMIAGYA